MEYLSEEALNKKLEALPKVGQLKMQNAAAQDAMRQAYIRMDALKYPRTGSTPDMVCAALRRQVAEAKAVIAANNQRIARLREEYGLSMDEAPLDLDEVTTDPEGPAGVF